MPTLIWVIEILIIRAFKTRVRRTTEQVFGRINFLNDARLHESLVEHKRLGAVSVPYSVVIRFSPELVHDYAVEFFQCLRNLGGLFFQGDPFP